MTTGLMQHSTERVLTTHAGSLPQPPGLADLLRAREAGQPVAEAQLAAQVRAAVQEMVTRQRACGLDVVSDGEQSKASFTTYARERLGGLEERPGSGPAGAVSDRQRRDYPEYFAAQPRTRRLTYCVAPLRYVGQAAVQADLANLRAALADAPPGSAFVPAVAPGTAEHWIINEHYPNDEAFVFALADALREEYQAIVGAGFLLQIDNPDLPDGWGLYADMSLEEYRRFQALRVEALNHALRGIPPEQVRMHVCWGAHRGPHDSDVPLRDIADLVLQVRVGGYSVEAANPRHAHEWRVWEEVKLPEGAVLIPGVVGHDSDTVEHPDLVAERLVRFAGLVGRENVVAGTDCGFGTGRVGHPAIAWAKLRALVDGARLASSQLWGS